MGDGVHAQRPSWTGALVRRVERLVAALLVIALGVLLGFEYMAPDKRVLSVLASLVIAGIAWRLEIIAAIGVMILALPFPKGLSFGTTNLVLVGLVVVIYLLRVGQRQLPRPRGTPIDMALVGLTVAYVVSFINVDAGDLTPAMTNFQLYLATVFMFYVVVNCVQSESDLRRLHGFQVATLIVIAMLAMWELRYPGKALVPGWIDFTSTTGDVFNTRNVRVRGLFHDYELLADYCGLNLIFLTFLLFRAQSVQRRVFVGSLIAITVFILFSTITRGPIFSLSAALLYMMWLMRRRLRVVPVVVGGAIIATTFGLANFVVANFTNSGSLFTRLSKTEIHGFTPDTRAAAWQSAWAHFLLHPIVGCGPFYSSRNGLNLWFWPHDLYLYILNIVGIFGFTFFVWMLWKLFAITRPGVDSPTAGSYAEGYMFVARVQLVFFLVDQTKIEYLRNTTYQYQVWLMIALWVAAARLRNAAPQPVAVMAGHGLASTHAGAPGVSFGALRP